MINADIINIKTQDAGLRLDSCLAAKLQGYSRSEIARYIKMGFIRVDGQQVKPSLSLVGNEEVSFFKPDIKPASLSPKNIPLDILYSDDAIAVINKQAGLVVHPGAGVNDTLCHALLYYFPDMMICDEKRPGIVHRLDKDTSGAMVIAKTKEAHQFLSTEFKSRCVKKIYRAWCWGNIEFDKMEFKTGHVRHPHNPLKFFTGLSVPKAPNPAVRFAHTSIAVERRSKDLSEILATLHTGRTHQIRAHMADNGHPLLGDQLYGGKRTMPKDFDEELKQAILELNGQALHAEHLSFIHPITKEPMAFDAPLPAHLRTIAELLEKN